MSLGIRTEHAWGDGGRDASCTLSLNVDSPQDGSACGVETVDRVIPRLVARDVFPGSADRQAPPALPLQICPPLGASHSGDGVPGRPPYFDYERLSDPGRIISAGQVAVSRCFVIIRRVTPDAVQGHGSASATS
jgi:hypothetical protein